MGVTRLSLGVENFSDAVLEENGRAHLSKQVYNAWDWIQAVKFPNVNIDLISGMVGETWENWRLNIAKTIELSPDSVTIYQMELPFNTVYSADILGNKKESPVADWPTKRAWVDYAMTELSQAGYSISSAYTMVKDASKVNFSYRDNLWMGSDLLATGVASFGFAQGVHYQNLADLSKYYDAIANQKLPLGRGFVPSREQLLIRQMILLLKKGYLDRALFSSLYDVDIYQKWQATWDDYVSQGWASISPTEIRLTREGLLRADGLLSAFFEPRYQGVRYT